MFNKLIQNDPYFCSSITKVWQESAIHMIGFPFDGTACFRKGAVNGPQAIRDVSDGFESYSPYLEKDIEKLPLYDFGDLPFENDWDNNLNYFNDMLASMPKSSKLLTFGGEHSISYAPIKKYLETHNDLVLLHLDAHADLMDGYGGYHYSHNSIIKRSIDHFGSGHELIQYGIRSGTKPEFDWMRENKTLQTSREQLIQKLESIDNNRPIYMTLDLDFFDPCYLPGTGTPEAGGEDFHFFIKLAKILRNKNLAGADIVELAPSIDPTGNSECFTAKLTREVLIILGMPFF